MADAVAAKAKKLPFKPTALRRAAAPRPIANAEDKTDKDDDGLALFSRSSEMAATLKADRETERKRRMKKRQKQKEAERRRSTPEKSRLEDDSDKSTAKATGAPQIQEGKDDGAVLPTDESVPVEADTISELVTPPPSKRTRTGSTSSKTPTNSSRQPIDSPSSGRYLRSRRKSSTRSREPRVDDVTLSGAPIISLDSDTDEDKKPAATPSKTRSGCVEVMKQSQSQSQSSQEEQKEDEDEFAEYIRKAEEEKRKLASQSLGANGTSSDATVAVLLTSAIEGSRDCCIKYFLDRHLYQVRDTWVKVQQKHKVGIPVSPADLILTWRRNKVYNYSTLHSLGIRRYGDSVITDGYSRKGLNTDGTQVHMEIWTPDMFKQWEQQEERRRKVQAGELSDREEEGAEEAKEEAESPEIKLKVVLKARVLDEVKLTVRPETTAETLITGFRTARGLDANKDVTVWFDGEMLEEHVTMEEAEIDDMDTIEVHVK